MSDIRVTCNHCNQVFSVPPELAGRSMLCPQCGKPVAAVSEAAPAGGGKCPSCEAPMAPGVVVCLQCGYDIRTGSRYVEQRQKSGVLQWILWGFGLVILAGLVNTFFLKDRGGKTDEPAAPREPPVSEAVTTASVPAAGEVAVETAEAEPQVESSSKPLAAPIPEDTRSPEEIAADEAAYRAKLNEQLGTTYPMYSPGDAVVLRRVNGQIHRGTLAGLKSDVVVVVQAGQTNEIPLKALDRASRLKCDASFRAQVVDLHVQKWAQQFADF